MSAVAPGKGAAGEKVRVISDREIAAGIAEDAWFWMHRPLTRETGADAEAAYNAALGELRRRTRLILDELLLEATGLETWVFGRLLRLTKRFRHRTLKPQMWLIRRTARRWPACGPRLAAMLMREAGGRN